jgi:ferritin
MLKEKVLDKINDQLNKELAAAHLYYSMAGYFESISLKGFANWMIIQAQEELTHSHRLFMYIIHRGARPVLTAADAPKHDWKTPLDAMKDAYKHECKVSEMINECVGMAIKEGDHMTNTMLQWFVNEQVEEEAAADDVVQKLKLIGDNSGALFMLDNELAGRTLAAEDGAE